MEKETVSLKQFFLLTATENIWVKESNSWL